MPCCRGVAKATPLTSSSAHLRGLAAAEVCRGNPRGTGTRAQRGRLPAFRRAAAVADLTQEKRCRIHIIHIHSSVFIQFIQFIQYSSFCRAFSIFIKFRTFSIFSVRMKTQSSNGESGRRSSSGTSGNYPNLLLSQTLPRPCGPCGMWDPGIMDQRSFRRMIGVLLKDRYGSFSS